MDRRLSVETVEPAPEPDERSWAARLSRLWTTPGPVPKRPALLLPLCLYMVLLGLPFLGLAGYLFYVPFGFAAGRRDFNLGGFLVIFVLSSLFAVLFALLGAFFVWLARDLWLGQERDTRRVGALGRVAGVFFLFLIAFGILRHPQNLLSDTTTQAIAELAVLAALVLVLVPLVNLPPIARYVAEVKRVRELEEMPRAPTLGADGVGDPARAAAAAEEDPETIDRQRFIHETFPFRRRGPVWSTTGRDVAVNIPLPPAPRDDGADPVVEFGTVVKCQSCKGTGSTFGRPPISCPRCKGTGRRMFKSEIGTAASSDPCPACYGYGLRPSPPPCQTCLGIGRVRGTRRLAVRFPPGVKAGARLRVAHQGEAGVLGGPAGDAVLRVAMSAGRAPNPS
jgi:hypothetical protein